MSPWAFWLKRGAKGGSASATEGHAPKSIPTATAIRTAIVATVRRHPGHVQHLGVEAAADWVKVR